MKIVVEFLKAIWEDFPKKLLNKFQWKTPREIPRCTSGRILFYYGHTKKNPKVLLNESTKIFFEKFSLKLWEEFSNEVGEDFLENIKAKFWWNSFLKFLTKLTKKKNSKNSPRSWDAVEWTSKKKYHKLLEECSKNSWVISRTLEEFLNKETQRYFKNDFQEFHEKNTEKYPEEVLTNFLNEFLEEISKKLLKNSRSNFQRIIEVTFGDIPVRIRGRIFEWISCLIP